MLTRRQVVSLLEHASSPRARDAAGIEKDVAGIRSPLDELEMERERKHESAKRNLLSGKPEPLEHTGGHPGRDEIHSHHGS